ncbi:hypothetical protein GRW34_22815, partial [Escherichia coli]|nr:hypothetical protein [Escherichia coli]
MDEFIVFSVSVVVVKLMTGYRRGAPRTSTLARSSTLFMIEVKSSWLRPSSIA